MLACVTLLGMDATHLPLLWIYSYCAALAVGLGVQAINAAFGGIGQLVSMFFDARGDAGLTRASTMTAIGAVIGVLFGFAMTVSYDRKGHKRLTPQPV